MAPNSRSSEVNFVTNMMAFGGLPPRPERGKGGVRGEHLGARRRASTEQLMDPRDLRVIAFAPDQVDKTVG